MTRDEFVDEMIGQAKRSWNAYWTALSDEKRRPRQSDQRWDLLFVDEVNEIGVENGELFPRSLYDREAALGPAALERREQAADAEDLAPQSGEAADDTAEAVELSGERERVPGPVPAALVPCGWIAASVRSHSSGNLMWLRITAGCAIGARNCALPCLAPRPSIRARRRGLRRARNASRSSRMSSCACSPTRESMSAPTT